MSVIRFEPSRCSSCSKPRSLDTMFLMPKATAERRSYFGLAVACTIQTTICCRFSLKQNMIC